MFGVIFRGTQKLFSQYGTILELIKLVISTLLGEVTGAGREVGRGGDRLRLGIADQKIQIVFWNKFLS